jgi:hypothetical protein
MLTWRKHDWAVVERNGSLTLCRMAEDCGGRVVMARDGRSGRWFPVGRSKIRFVDSMKGNCRRELSKADEYEQKGEAA